MGGGNTFNEMWDSAFPTKLRIAYAVCVAVNITVHLKRSLKMCLLFIHELLVFICINVLMYYIVVYSLFISLFIYSL